MKKKLVIIIPGTKLLKRWPKIIQIFGNFFCTLFRLDSPSIEKTMKNLKEYLQSKKREVIFMRWNRGISRLSKWFAKRKLRNLLEKYKNYEISIIGISMAGDIILETIEKIQPTNIKLIILLCSINSNKEINFKTPKIINIYSKSDNLAQVATKILSPINGGQRLKGKNIENINLPKITHKDFLEKGIIKEGKFKNKKIPEMINYFLERN